jgi:hypothetical protein
VLPPTGGPDVGGGPSLGLLVLLGGFAFISGAFLVSYAARRRQEQEIRIDE